jgi:transcriptional regulator with XRE-family HTH domain
MSRSPTRRYSPSGTRTGVERLELQDFARKLQELRIAKGWNQSDLARAIWGTTTDSRGRTVAKSRDRISEYEKGISVPEPDNMQKVADALGVTVEELAPRIVANAIDREDPAMQLTMVTGHPGRVHLVINQLLPLSVAAQIVALVQSATPE